MKVKKDDKATTFINNFGNKTNSNNNDSISAISFNKKCVVNLKYN